MLNKIVLFLPNILVAVIILVIGQSLQEIVRKLLTSILSGVGTMEIIKKQLVQTAQNYKTYLFQR